MKKLILIALWLMAGAVGAGPNDVTVDQRTAADTGFIRRYFTTPTDGSSVLMYFNGATLLPGYLSVGSGLTLSSGVLSAAAGTPQVQSDWNATAGIASILNRPTLKTVALTAAYGDLIGAPVLATVATSGAYADLAGRPAIPAAQVNADWSATSGVAQVLNKPTLAAVATSGSYADLSSKPAIPAAQVNADWNASSGVAQVLNKPALATVATSGAYADLTGKPAVAGAFNFGVEVMRTLVVGTAYQANDPSKAAELTITPACTVSATVLAPSTCTVQIRRAAAAPTCSTGTVVSQWSNNVSLGLIFTNASSSPMTVKLPIGGYFILCAVAGTFTVPFAVDQTAG